MNTAFRVCMAALGIAALAAILLLAPESAPYVAMATVAAAPLDQLAAEMQRIMGETKGRTSELDARLGHLEQLVVQAQKAGLGITQPISPDHVREAIRSKFLGSQAFADFKERGVATGKCDLGLNFKSLVSIQGGGSSGNGIDVQGQRTPGLFGYGMREFTLLGGLTPKNVDTNRTECHQMEGFVAAAATQEAEGDVKAEQAIDPLLTTFPVETIAVWIPVSRQLLDDDDSILGSLTRLLGHTVIAKAERQAIYGSGTSGQMRGFFVDATTHTTTGGTIEDEVGDAAATMAANGYAPAMVAINPIHWREIQARKSGTDGHYLMGSPASPIAPSLWGMNAIVTPAIDYGDVLLLDNRYASLLDRQRVTVYVGFEDDTNLRKNMATVLVEGRWGVELLDRAAATKIVDFGSSSGS